MFSDPFNEGDDATSMNNQVLDNEMGRNGTDTNAVDFWIDGSGAGNCFSGNDSSTFAPTGDASATIQQLYPSCPIPGGVQPNPGATGSSSGNGNMVGQLLSYVLSSTPPDDSNPAQNQQCTWVKRVPRTRRSRSTSRSKVDAEPGCTVLMRALKVLVAVVAVVALAGARHRGERARSEIEAEGSVGRRLLLRARKLTLKEGQSVNWVWAEANTYPHDVHLKSGPKG